MEPAHARERETMSQNWGTFLTMFSSCLAALLVKHTVELLDRIIVRTRSELRKRRDDGMVSVSCTGCDHEWSYATFCREDGSATNWKLCGRCGHSEFTPVEAKR